MTTPASYTPGAGGGHFASGTTPTPQTGHANPAPSALAVHSMGGMTSGQDDGAWQDYERESGSYQPGQFEGMEDQLSQGSDEDAA